jgi:hypothetical protein
MNDFLIHFYKRGSEPFRSLSSLPDAEASQIMKDLYIEGSIFWERFKDPAWYLQARRQTEGWLRREFIAKGGEPREEYPIYMVLGLSLWVERHADPATLATTEQISVPLALFGEGDISFTYPDSMVTSLVAYLKDPSYYLPDLHGKVFTLSEMRAILEIRGSPDRGWGLTLPDHLANYVEAQVWNREPLLPLMPLAVDAVDAVVDRPGGKERK